MRIGFSALLTEGGRSGIGQHIINLLGALQEIDRANQYVIFVLAGDRSLEAITAPNFTVVRVPGFFSRPIASILWHWTVLPILVRRWRLDLVHLPSYRRLCPLSPCPVVVTVHDLAVLHEPAKYGKLRHLYVRSVIRRLLKQSTQIIPVSESTRQDVLGFVGFNPERVSVSHNGIDHKRYYPMDREYCRAEVARRYGIHPAFILCVARLEHPGKNLVRLIEAFTRLKSETGLPHQLVLAGARWNGAEAIYQAAEVSGFAKDVVFPGFVPAEDLPLFYNAADLFVLPSLHEGFGIPVVEALACGTPVASSKIAALTEVGGNGVLYFEPLNVLEILETMARLIDDPLLRGRCREQRLERARRFTWEESADKTQAAYRQAAGQEEAIQAHRTVWRAK